MPTLSSDLRNKLERTCVAARDLAEQAARAALESVAVQHPEAYAHMPRAQKDLRNKLRARGRQLGDVQDTKDHLTLHHLAQECGYEHWHRMLFARFLAENNLLIPPDLGTPITLDECKELAKEEKMNLWALAGRYAQTMLPEIFRADNPVLQVPLAREDQLKLDDLLNELPVAVFTASDSLGWCYQFWQAEEKNRVNKSGDKIGADELSAVTQLFTEDYMVDFMLDNTLGAWWWGRCAAVQGSGVRVQGCKTEEECRRLVALPGCPWKYLRFVKDEKTGWRPAAGTFDGWPKSTKALTCLDPCCGSGHFVVAMFERLVAMRMAEEKSKPAIACDAAIRENLFGLEIDERCTQIAAFALALAAWRYPGAGGYRNLPPVNIACVGLSVGGTKEQWLKVLADRGNPNLRFFFGQLYDLFKQAPTLGSLINPTRFLGSGIVDEIMLDSLLSTLADVLDSDPVRNPDEHEMGVTAQGVAHAAKFLAGHYTLVGTNVPYLVRGKQDELLKQHIETYYPLGKTDLAMAFLLRCLEFCQSSGTATLVTPQNWLFLGSSARVREMLLANTRLNSLVSLGPGAFDTITGHIVNVVLCTLTKAPTTGTDAVYLVDVSETQNAANKANELLLAPVGHVNQSAQLHNPDARISSEEVSSGSLLNEFADSYQGIVTGDIARFTVSFWEVLAFNHTWVPFRRSNSTEESYGDVSNALRWENGKGVLHEYASLARDQLHDMHESGNLAWKHCGVAVNRMTTLAAVPYYGEHFDNNVAVIIPKHPDLLGAVLAFAQSEVFGRAVRHMDRTLKVTNQTLLKVRFDHIHWQKVAAKMYENGFPEPSTSDPTQWAFHGSIANAASPLHVAVALMTGYVWPNQKTADIRRLGSGFDEAGISCIPSIRGEPPAAERLRRILANVYGTEWTESKERELISKTGSNASDLDDWLRNDFFQQHCELFHHRPFVWHVWDGRKRDGFHALLNYHKLADGANGRKLLEKLTHAYLNDWVARQKDGEKRGEDGAEERLAAALELKTRLEAIIEGASPFDIFVRWKPLQQQAIGWYPDINDGVRMNIRPFMSRDIPGAKSNAGILRCKPKIKWDKDRGKEPKRPIRDFPWFWGWDGVSVDFIGNSTSEFTGERWNDCHYTLESKRKARQYSVANRELHGIYEGVVNDLTLTSDVVSKNSKGPRK
jgi:hypothetical protein